MITPSFPLGRADIDPQALSRLNMRLYTPALVYERDPDVATGYRIERDHHVNIPTVLAARLPEFYTIAAALYGVTEHNRRIKSHHLIARLSDAHARHLKARERRARELVALTAQLATKKLTRRERVKRLDAFASLPDEEGMEITLPAYSKNFYVDGHVPEPH